MGEKESKENIERFLYDTLGYAKIREIMEQEHPGSESLQELLTGTVIETFKKTFKKTSYSDFREKAELKQRVYRNRFQVAPHIFESGELEKQSKNKWYLRDKRIHLKDIPGKIRTKRYFLSHGKAFMKMTQTEVKTWLDQVNEQFPDAEYNYKSPSNFWGTIEESDFYLHVGGQRTRKDGKVIVVAFNLPEESVEEINELARQYNHYMNIVKYHGTAMISPKP
jgi:hypothetical protein